MKVPKYAVPFICGRVNCARCVVRDGPRKWDLYLHRGERFVTLRLSRRDRPWVCFRFSGGTPSWDRGTFGEREDFLVSFLRKVQRPESGQTDRPDASDPQLAKLYPALSEHLCRSRDDDGVQRQTCSLTVFGAAGGFRAFLNDRDSGASIAVFSESFSGILSALECDLQCDHPNWYFRTDQARRPSTNGRKKA